MSIYLLLLVALFGLASSSGINTHQSVAHRTLLQLNDTALKDLLYRNQPAFQSGVAFPDWGYLPRDIFYPLSPGANYYFWAEEAHFPNFIIELVKYIIAKWPDGHDEGYPTEAETLISFVYGLCSHSVADILWHNLENVEPTGQGFLQAMGSIEFTGTDVQRYNFAHSIGDEGTDFVATYSSDFGFLDLTWTFPTEDVVNVYRSMGYPTDNTDYFQEADLLIGVQTYYVLTILTIVGNPLYTTYAYQTTFLPNYHFDYFIGGIDDMAQWTDRCWRSIAEWLEEGTTENIPLCYIQQDINYASPPLPDHTEILPSIITQELNNLKALFNNPAIKKLLDVLKLNLHLSKTNLGLTISPIIPFAEFIQQKQSILGSIIYNLLDLTDNAPPLLDCIPNTGIPLLESSLTIHTNQPLSYLGSSVVIDEFNGTTNSLIIGAPGYGDEEASQRGAVYIVSNIEIVPRNGLLREQKDLFVEDTDPVYKVTKLTGETAGSRFGHAITIVDLDKDGENDLVVSAPQYDSENLDYRGKIYIHFGSRSDVVTINVAYAPYPSPNQFDRSTEPDGPLSGAYTNAGTTLAAFDVDRDGFKDLVIGSHFACDIEKKCEVTDPLQRGLVSIFLSSKWTQITSGSISLLNANWKRYGVNRYDWFGFHINFLPAPPSQKNLMIIGAPASLDSSKAESGKLYGYDLEDIMKQVNGIIVSAQPKWIIKGNKQFDLVGTHTSIGRPYASNVDYLAISLTARDSTGIFNQQLNQTGAVIIINPAGLTGEHTIESLKPTSTYIKGKEDETYGRLGWYSAWSGKDFWLSAPFMNNHGGKVFSYQRGLLDPPFPAPGTTSTTSIFNLCYQDKSSVRTKGGRYGSKIIFPSNSDSNVESIITAPRASETGFLILPTIDTTGKVFVIYD